MLPRVDHDLCEGWMRRLGQDVIAVDFAHAGRALPLRLFPCLQAQVDELCVGHHILGDRRKDKDGV